ncbi:DEAD/DEAH box helicase [Oricola sp.]|uniref:DEAD/DEAH box helicase n=1 Tax=Oricola sp. TaxID=1979950 RepID=UPI0025EAD117|nr:DEAD/DEAH box helicase [Oricola sp.]MCI5078172.1 DEAD/DEAH box helicase [Oricola sp.]
MTEFSSLGLSERILHSVAAAGYTSATPIQAAAIPAVLEGHDIMGLAQTGTGKTAAFGLPLIEKLLANPQRPFPKSVRALILAPTRELANQITTNLKGYVKRSKLQIATVVGGQSINVQMRDLGPGKDILVATPGRLIDLMERGAIILAQTHFLVLDEADQMLDLGFIHSLKRIAKALPKERQTLLFSATMPAEIESLSKTYLNDPVRIEVSPAGKTADKIDQSVHFVSQRAKADLLKKHLSERDNDLSLVFARTKHGAEKLMKHLVSHGFEAASIHGNKSQGQRDRAIREFRAGNVRILVATDVAARGIDIPGVSHVYNFDLPQVPESYVHRIGRTARAGAEGRAISFCSEEETKMLRDIEKLTGVSLTIASGEHPGFGAGARKDNRGKRGQSSGRPQGEKRSDPSADNQNRTKRPHRGKRPQSAAQPSRSRDEGASAAPGRSAKPKWRRNRKSRAA